jgi:hypothetical protein
MATLEEKEARQKAIDLLYCGEGFFAKTSKEELAKLEAEKAELVAEIDRLMKEWEALEAEISALA